ncbi:putative NBD/HSP70 family sugar kinase [Kushneria sinocarnis]|uniref:Putative NBD/HSP70 family sugar kinase n=1 Tax=Kushneria sinocarnis TaxID=595502 RepID=A0A420WWQ1_9GAMM|nr:ROK family transcriptional regulator [Kushneria sinocarnis]RKR03524.1 putative NBD/HSP70 family sugar kinase [Kushneria sinocarnis]
MTGTPRPHHGGNLSFLKRHNRSAILETVRRSPGVTRADIAVLTGLTKATVGAIVQDLLHREWLREGELRQSGGGRPGRSLHPDASRHVLLGVDAGVKSLRLIACTLAGEPLLQRHLEQAPTTPEETAGVLAARIREMLADETIRHRHCLGLGVTLPGPVAPDQPLLRLAPNLGWRDIPFLELLKPLLPEITGHWLLDNEANAAAFGEYYFHPGVPPESLVYLSASTGIGSGLVAGDGQMPTVVRGRGGLVGEIGHTILQPGGLYCHCGNRGCVETLVSGWAIRAALNIPPEQGVTEALWPRLSEPEVALTLRRAGEALGMLLLNLHHTLNPPEIVIGGSLTGLGDALLVPALDYFERHRSGLLNTDGQVAIRVLDDSTFTAARGAAAEVMARAVGAP